MHLVAADFNIYTHYLYVYLWRAAARAYTRYTSNCTQPHVCVCVHSDIRINLYVYPALCRTVYPHCAAASSACVLVKNCCTRKCPKELPPQCVCVVCELTTHALSLHCLVVVSSHVATIWHKLTPSTHI